MKKAVLVVVDSDNGVHFAIVSNEMVHFFITERGIKMGCMNSSWKQIYHVK